MELEIHHRTIPQIYLFVNSSSGGGIGRQLLDLKIRSLKIQVPASQYNIDIQNKVQVTLNIFDMSQTQIREEGFTLLKRALQQNVRIILVICGGDGSVMWVVSELSKFNIDHSKCPIAMLPLGTGNDFSQILGWGKQCPSDLLSNDFAKLKKRVSYWFSAIEENLDIWMVQASVQNYGKFEKVSKSVTTLIEGKIFSKHFCNYFSIGIDGKVGYSFDLHRTTSRLGNLAVYGVMGLLKSFTKTKTIGQLTHQFKQLPQDSLNVNSVQISAKSVGRLQQLQKERGQVILVEGNESFQEVKDNQNLLFLNIDSFMGGVKGIWKNSKPSPNLKDEPMTNASTSDGKIEILSFGGVWSFGFEKSIGGFATKLYQGSGPFYFEFNKFPEEGKHRTYLQVDGEFIRYTHPKQLVIKKSTLSKNGVIRILKRVPLQVQRTCCC